MSDNGNRKKTVADDAVRASKLLDRNKPQPIGPSEIPGFRLTQNEPLGEFSVVLFVTSLGTQSYTICRPIGITELDADDWILVPSGQVKATLARASDPRKGELEKQRSVYRNTALVSEGLLQEEQGQGTRVLYYPSDNRTPRNAHLGAAKAASKAAVKALRKELEELPKKGSGAARQELNARIQAEGKLENYLPEPQRSDEAAIRTRIRTLGPEVEALHPSTHRTFIGPFGDQPQRPIRGMKGLALLDVNSAIQKSLITGEQMTLGLPDEVGGQGQGADRMQNATGATVTTPALTGQSGEGKDAT